MHTGHGPGALVSGQTMIVKTSGKTVDEAVVVPVAMIAATFGEGAHNEKSPGTRAKAIAMLREEMLKAEAYKKKMAGADETKRPERNLHSEAFVKLLDGELPLLVTAHRHQDIISAMRLAAEFHFKLVL